MVTRYICAVCNGKGGWHKLVTRMCTCCKGSGYEKDSAGNDVPCGCCSGNGYVEDTEWETCAHCHGTGEVD